MPDTTSLSRQSNDLMYGKWNCRKIRVHPSDFLCVWCCHVPVPGRPWDRRAGPDSVAVPRCKRRAGGCPEVDAEHAEGQEDRVQNLRGGNHQNQVSFHFEEFWLQWSRRLYRRHYVEQWILNSVVVAPPCMLVFIPPSLVQWMFLKMC